MHTANEQGWLDMEIIQVCRQHKIGNLRALGVVQSFHMYIFGDLAPKKYFESSP